MTFASPLATPVTLLHSDGASVAARVRLDHGDPAFTGHYPGFPVLPGVLAVEYAGAALRAARPEGAWELRGIGNARFRRPIRPGDVLTIDLDLTEAGDGLAVRAKLATEDGPAADLRLDYADGRA
ncbi:3-hydroxyacyl-ACP dehydratase FabZ family protein [Paractinoplanes rishiriensis]|uniref:Beta-hydroxyacyl-ACP dehydratase n=1 Tax=Paractinoplanes rishiriensis TaxID=1050105 RepID=A0A919KDD0_9ACTN|nr:3-hydroxyacyl-ACP dehydratase FabZ family protein [Actinoplanes rishiriensis]GIF02267.1 beta-hydroxyacyl-ACP dehydratase [Actinoplanes rishiriensis]